MASTGKRPHPAPRRAVPWAAHSPAQASRARGRGRSPCPASLRGGRRRHQAAPHSRPRVKNPDGGRTDGRPAPSRSVGIMNRAANYASLTMGGAGYDVDGQEDPPATAPARTGAPRRRGRRARGAPWLAAGARGARRCIPCREHRAVHGPQSHALSSFPAWPASRCMRDSEPPRRRKRATGRQLAWQPSRSLSPALGGRRDPWRCGSADASPSAACSTVT
jgi:hypothetical protein